MNQTITLTLAVAAMAVISTLITFVLFKKLSSFTEGQGKIMGHTIKYGGAVGGFVLVFGLLNYSFENISSSITPSDTSIDLNGEWYIKLTPHDKEIVAYGRCEIRQKKGSDDLHMSGEIRSLEDPPSITFYSKSASVEESSKQIVFIYRNQDDELGIGMGNVMTDTPKSFFVKYFDVGDTDINMDSEGKIKFSREPFSEQIEEKENGSDSWYLGKAE